MIENEIYCYVNGFLKWNISKESNDNILVFVNSLRIFLEILYINLLNTVKCVHNGHLGFLDKVFVKTRCPAR